MFRAIRFGLNRNNANNKFNHKMFFTHESKKHNIIDSCDIFKNSIKNICDKLYTENTRKEIKDAVFKTYTNNVQQKPLTEIGYIENYSNLVNLKKLMQITNYNNDIILYKLYNEGFKYANNNLNIFNLYEHEHSEFNTDMISNITFDLSDQVHQMLPQKIINQKINNNKSRIITTDVYNNHTNSHDFADKLIKNIFSDNNSYYDEKTQITRYYFENSNLIILHKEGKYDVTELLFVKESLDKNNYYMRMVMIEKRDQNVNISATDISNIMMIYNNYIKTSNKKNIVKIGNVIIGLSFDNDGIFDTTVFNFAYGINAFHKAILNDLADDINFKHNLSIRNKETMDIINNSYNNIRDYFYNKDNMTHEIFSMLYDDFMSMTTHTNNDTIIDITELMNCYNINSEELLYGLYILSDNYKIDELSYGLHIMNNPFETQINKFITNMNNKFTLTDAKNNLITRQFYIEYLHGRSIKNAFRVDYNGNQILYIKKYDDSTRVGNTYKILFSIMYYKVTYGALSDHCLIK